MLEGVNIKIEVMEHALGFYKHGFPVFATNGSAAIDVVATYHDRIDPKNVAFIPLGIKTEIPIGFCAKIYPRSGLSTKYGIVLANNIGVVDSDYRDEWKVALYNRGSESFYVSPGDRIAQVVIERYYSPLFELGVVHKNTERTGGFGSTGK